MMQGIVGTDPLLKYSVPPTGGMVVLEPQSSADFSTWTITRYLSVSGQAVSGVVLVQGNAADPATQVLIDMGDGPTVPLDSTQLYLYELNTSAGAIQTPALSPACSIVLEEDELSAILYRALESGITALKLPASFKNKPTVMHAMPLAGAGLPRLPAICFTEVLLQSQDYQIGEDVGNIDDSRNRYDVATQALRHFSVAVLATNTKERSYYKDAVIAIFNSILGPVMEKIGNNIRHRFQASSSQIVGRQNEPGFYLAEILLEFQGLYSTGITTSYGVIEDIESDPTETMDSTWGS